MYIGTKGGLMNPKRKKRKVSHNYSEDTPRGPHDGTASAGSSREA